MSRVPRTKQLYDQRTAAPKRTAQMNASESNGCAQRADHGATTTEVRIQEPARTNPCREPLGPMRCRPRSCTWYECRNTNALASWFSTKNSSFMEHRHLANPNNEAMAEPSHDSLHNSRNAIQTPPLRTLKADGQSPRRGQATSCGVRTRRPRRQASTRNRLQASALDPPTCS